MNGYYKHFEQPFNTGVRVYVEWRGGVGMVKIGNGNVFSSLTLFTIQRGFKDAIMVKDERGEWQRVEGVTAYDLTKRMVDYLTRIDDTKLLADLTVEIREEIREMPSPQPLFNQKPQPPVAAFRGKVINEETQSFEWKVPYSNPNKAKK
jgi:hypothetical protein